MKIMEFEGTLLYCIVLFYSYYYFLTIIQDIISVIFCILVLQSIYYLCKCKDFDIENHIDVNSCIFQYLNT